MEWLWIFFLTCYYPSKDAEMKLGHFLLVKLSNCIDIVRVGLAGLTKRQKCTFFSLTLNLWGLFAFLWGTAKDCGRKGQVTLGDTGNLSGSWLHSSPHWAEMVSFALVQPSHMERSCWDVLAFLISMGRCFLCLSRHFHSTDLLLLQGACTWVVLPCRCWGHLCELQYP